MVAVVATDEPQIAPKAVQAPIAAIATPPRRLPITASAALNRSCDRPARSARAPIRMNSGMTESV